MGCGVVKWLEKCTILRLLGAPKPYWKSAAIQPSPCNVVSQFIYVIMRKVSNAAAPLTCAFWRICNVLLVSKQLPQCFPTVPQLCHAIANKFDDNGRQFTCNIGKERSIESGIQPIWHRSYFGKFRKIVSAATRKICGVEELFCGLQDRRIGHGISLRG